MLVIWVSDIRVKHGLFHTQLSHNVGQLGIGIPFTHSIRELSHAHPQVRMAALNHSITVCVWLRIP